MQNSGSRLVLALIGLALLLGIVSWWYRYEAAHRASQFWGSEAARLIAEAEGFEVTDAETDALEATDLSHARGQAHLRHALMSDGNYRWDRTLESESLDWRWTLRFFEQDREVLVLLSGDLRAIGKSDNDGVEAYSCEVMASSIGTYFQEIGLLKKSQTTASTAAE